ncbi:uncharacterized protein LOC143277429 [Babylonia areolata]|uniref:uncharacterized protein LOC143277429 n=1 Tax=Babylonia areolata TaxID=304850 RepID=UPI003FD0CDD0
MAFERQNNLSRQRRNTEEIDLPESMITFFKCHFHIIENEIPGVEIPQRNNGTEFLQVTSVQSQHDLFGLLSRFFSCQIPVDAAHTSYLDSPEGYEAMKRIEKRNECVIKTHPPSILLTATSSCGHTVCVHEGRIENNNCQVLVLPLCAERSVWSPQIQHILRRDILTWIEEDYTRWVGPSPKAGGLFLRCPLDRTRSVVVIHVPQTIGGKEADYIRGTLKNVMKKAAERRESVAIPYDLFIKSGLRKEIIFQSIVDVFSGNTPASLLKLYLDAGNSETSVLRENISTFLEYREWSCDFAGGRSVRMHVGDVLDLKADVIVNSSHKMLDMTHGQLSQVLLKAAGPELSKQCKARYPKGIDDHVVAVTDCFQLKAFQKIFHILLPSMNAKVQDIRYPHLEWIRTRTQACLALASAMGYKSIVFPTLGVGPLFYLPQEVAETMFTTFREFFNEMPHSSLHDVTVVCFPKNTAVFQHFKMAEIKFALQEDMNSISEVVMEVKGVQIQIIQGDVQQHTCAAGVVIVAKGAEHTVMSDGLKPEIYSVCQEKFDKDFRWILSSVEKRLLPFCLQINLETFKRRYYQDVVAAVVKCLREAKNLKVVTFVVLTPKEHQEVREAFEKASQRSFPAPQHAMAPGQKKAPNTASPAGKVHICGELRFVENATEEILQLQIPEKFQAEEEIQKMDQSFVESSVDGKEFQQGRQDGGDISIVQKRSEVEVADEACEDGRRRTHYQHHDVGRNETADNHLSGTASTHSSKPSVWSKEIDVLEHEALRFLLGQTFLDNFDSHQTAGDRILIKAKTANSPKETIEKIDVIRREDVQADNVSGTLTFDPAGEGMEAYIKVLPPQGKVAVFCFDYTTMTKAKHFVQVKTGVVKTTTRHRRRFDDGGRSGQREDNAPYTHQAWHQQTSSLELTTTVGRIKVSVYRTDITKLPVDAIVNAANEHLAHGGGVAYAIARAAGFSLESDGDEYIRKFGPLKVTQVVATTGGALPCRKVLHAVGPRWTDYKDKTQYCQHLSDTVYNCFSLASENGFTSLAVSSISSVIFGVPQQTCSECYLAAVQRFDEEWGHRTSLQHIHFVDVNDTMVSVIQNTFRNSWNTPVTIQLARSQSESPAGDSAPVSESRGQRRRRPEPTKVGPARPQPTGSQPTRPEPTRPEPTSPDVQPSQLSSHQAGG